MAASLTYPSNFRRRTLALCTTTSQLTRSGGTRSRDAARGVARHNFWQISASSLVGVRSSSPGAGSSLRRLRTPSVQADRRQDAASPLALAGSLSRAITQDFRLWPLPCKRKHGRSLTSNDAAILLASLAFAVVGCRLVLPGCSEFAACSPPGGSACAVLRNDLGTGCEDAGGGADGPAPSGVEVPLGHGGVVQLSAGSRTGRRP
jgi:hypothetical protein